MVLVKANTKQGFEAAEIGDFINLSYPNSKTRRGRVGHGVAQTIQANRNEGGALLMDKDYGIRVRRLTPKECWRLFDFDDTDFEKARQAMNDKFYNGKDRSGTQLYKQAGNSIVINTARALLKNLFDANVI